MEEVKDLTRTFQPDLVIIESGGDNLAANYSRELADYIIYVIDVAGLECAVPENIHTLPTEGIGISWGIGGSMRQKNLKKCMILNWNSQKGGAQVLEKIPSVGEVWIFSGTTQY